MIDTTPTPQIEGKQDSIIKLENDNNSNNNNHNDASTTNLQPEIKISRTNNVILIPQLDVIDKELSFKQRMNRPFKVIQNLPISNNKPDYSLLENPLSIKDSSVLYNSLIVSRHNLLHNVFRAYWTRREQYINVLNDRSEKG